MKKVFLLSVVLFAFLAACKPNLPIVTEEVSTVNPEFFYTVKDTVVKGDNTWNKSIHYFGNGYRWIDIVNNNAFLQKPGRVWRDSKTGTWYCLILPGEVLDMGTKFVNPVFEEDQVYKKGIIEFIRDCPWWLWLIIMAILGALIGTAITEDKKAKQKKEKSKFSSDPTKEGKPFVEGGIKNESEASDHFVSLARRSNPGLNPSKIVIKDKERVYISTQNGESAVVEFADGTKDDLCFRNVIGWVAMVSIDGGKTFNNEAFFQDCGNPVYSRTSMKEAGLIITKEPIIFGDEEKQAQQNQEVFEKDSASPEQIAEAKKSLEEKARIAKNDEVSIEVEVLKVASEHNLIAVDFLKTTNAHKVTLEVVLPSGASVTTILETKNQPGKTDKKTEDKTEGKEK